MPDSLTDFQDYLSNLREAVDNIVGQQLESKARSSIDTVARAALRDILMEIGMAAFHSIDEYASNGALEERFSQMLARPSHVSVRDGIVETAFNEDIAGDEIDLFNVPNQHTLTAEAPLLWKYGIYGPAHGGPYFTRSARLQSIATKLPDYDTVIQERLDYWGDRAPFWILIDKGTAAFGDGDRAYPQFAGTNFVDQFRAIAPRVVARTKQFYLQNMAESLGADIEQIIREPKKGTRVVVTRIPVNDGSLSVLLSSAGNVFFQIGHRGVSFEEARAIIRRSYT